MNVDVSSRAPEGVHGRITVIRYWRLTLLSIVLAMMGTNVAWAQSVTGCPGHKAMTLDQVVALLANLKDDARAIGLIESCHVSFAVDVHALDRLSEAGASEGVLDALNKVTAPDLTLGDARSQVAELERHIQQNDAAVNAERGTALRKSDAEYQAQRDQAAKIAPKSEFESTADYNARVQQNRNTLEQMDGKHRADQGSLAATFAAEGEKKDQPYRARAEFLKGMTYPDLRAITYSSYDADNQILYAVLDGDSYVFEQVPSTTAQTLVKNWPKVKVSQPFSEDEIGRRYLALASVTDPVPGYSRKAKLEVEGRAHVAEAKARASRGDQAGAITEYQAAITAAPDNQAAKDGLAAIEAAQQAQAARLEAQRAAGEWVDPRTNLMWTLQDNGAPIDLKGAFEYCQALRTGRFSNWRIASVEELAGLYDPKSTRNTPPTKRSIFLTDNGKIYRIPAGNFAQYHITAAITLTTELIWSGSQYEPDPRRIGLLWDYQRGRQVTEGFTEGSKDKVFFRVLCVRSFNPAVDGIDDSQRAGVSQNTDGNTVAAAPPLSPSESADAVQKAVAFYYKKQYQDALPLSEQACASGNQDGCALEGFLYAFGFGVKADPARGKELMAKSCEASNSIGCDVLGMAYIRGVSVPADPKKAVELLTSSCNGGFYDGCANMGMCYLYGIGVQQDNGRALENFDRACTLGHDQLTALCQGGYSGGCRSLARCYSRGVAVQQDLAKAKDLLNQACKMGERAACAEALNLK
jgi:uncharacterized protein